MVTVWSRSQPKAIIELLDPKNKTKYDIEQDFVDKVLDFRNKLKGRTPTRSELAILRQKTPESIEQEIDWMFRRFANGLSCK